MINRRTKVQLLVFVIITLVGVTFVGARYAQLDRLIIDQSYTVVAHYPESGGIFAGGEVTYRGVRIGKVDKLVLSQDGVDVHLEIDNEWDEIPADSKALVGNRSALGEQYVELQPNVDTEDGPFLEDGDEIDDVATPIQTDKLLGDLAQTVGSVDLESLKISVSELGDAFEGTGADLQKIIDTGNSFIETADANFDITTALIRDSNTVLQGQIDSEGSLRTFASQLQVFSRAMVAADTDLRRVIDNGSFTANQLRTFLEQNEGELADLLNNVIQTGQVVVKNIAGLRSLFIAYPILLEGSFGVVSENPATGQYETHVGLILGTTTPCYDGYEGTVTRGPQNVEDWDLNLQAKCVEPATKSNPRGYQNLPRTTPDLDGVPDETETMLGSFDPETGRFDSGNRASSNDSLGPSGSVAPPSLGEDSWKWLYAAPLMDAGE